MEGNAYWMIRNNSPNAHKAGKELALHLTTSHPNERRKSRQKKKPFPWITTRKEEMPMYKDHMPLLERIESKGKAYTLACEAGCTLAVVLLLFVAGMR